MYHAEYVGKSEIIFNIIKYWKDVINLEGHNLSNVQSLIEQLNKTENLSKAIFINSHRRCSIKKAVLKISPYSQESICAGAYLFKSCRPRSANLLK